MRLPGRSYVLVDTESVGSRRNHLNILVWRVFGHATASRADAGPCTLNWGCYLYYSYVCRKNVCMYVYIYRAYLVILLVLIMEKGCFKKLFCTLLRFPECISLTIHNSINIYICSFFFSGFSAGNISILCVLTLKHFLSVLYIFFHLYYI